MRKEINDIDGKPYNRLLLMCILLIGAFCIVINQTLLLMAYPTIMKDFQVTLETIQWLTTVFFLFSGITIPLYAYLMSRINSKYLFLLACTLFLAGILISYFSESFNILLLGLLFQGIAAGIMMPFMQTIIINIFSIKERGLGMGIASLVVGLAPAIGPTL